MLGISLGIRLWRTVGRGISQPKRRPIQSGQSMKFTHVGEVCDVVCLIHKCKISCSRVYVLLSIWTMLFHSMQHAVKINPNQRQTVPTLIPHNI